jgi:hypothetical protein
LVDRLLSFETKEVIPSVVSLDGNQLRNKIALSTYSRSGNTLLRKYFEEITHVATGSDQDLSDMLCYALYHQGFAYETVCDDKPWIVKTHFPLCEEA